MTKEEMVKLSGMLDAFFTSAPAGQRASGNENIFLAYYLALEPFSYAQAREGIIVHSRKSRMYPAPCGDHRLYAGGRGGRGGERAAV